MFLQINTLMVKLGVKTFGAEHGNKLLIVVVLENNLQA